MELLGPLPVQPVEGGGGAVAVALPLFGAGKLFPRLPERQAHAGEVNASRQPVLGQRDRVHGPVLRALVPDEKQFVPEGEVVVGGDIAHDLPGAVGRQGAAAAPGRDRRADIPQGAFLALHIARLPGVKTAALDGIPGVIAEDADPLVQHGQIVFVGFVPVEGADAALPGLAVHQDVPAAGELIQFGPEQVHGLHVVQAHQVEPEAVDVVLPGPVEDRVDEIPPGHGTLAGKLVAAAAAIGKAAVLVLAEIIIGHGPVQDVIVAIHVVVHHVHNDANARRVEGGDHLLALPDAHLAPGGVGGVAALRDVEVGGVVAPVVLPGQRTALVHAAKIKDGHELDVRDAQPLEIIQAGGVDAVGVQGGALLGKGQIFAPPGRADAAGRVLGEIPDVDLPHRAVGDGDLRAVVMQPARWVNSGKIGDHAPLAVHARRSGVGVGGLPAGVPGVEGIGVVVAVLVAGGGRPTRAPAPAFPAGGSRCRPRRPPGGRG